MMPNCYFCVSVLYLSVHKEWNPPSHSCSMLMELFQDLRLSKNYFFAYTLVNEIGIQLG